MALWNSTLPDRDLACACDPCLISKTLDQHWTCVHTVTQLKGFISLPFNIHSFWTFEKALFTLKSLNRVLSSTRTTFFFLIDKRTKFKSRRQKTQMKALHRWGMQAERQGGTKLNPHLVDKWMVCKAKVIKSTFRVFLHRRQHIAFTVWSK